ncbi:MAG: peptide chain release factor N(5)-glutamine methyltransferase [Alphaproteobacteria bacterium]
MQIQQALNWAKSELKDIEEGGNDALLLLSYITNKDKAMLIAFGDEELLDNIWIEFQQVIKQRKKYIPVSQIIGEQPFWQWSFKISDDVLTPRADSEVLIEATLKDFPNRTKEYKIADFGTGSGCLLLSALSEFSNAQGYGLDISEAALKIAQKNEDYLKKQGAEFQSPHWVLGSWEALKEYASFDIILANPPYIAEAEQDDLGLEVLKHDPHLALFAEDNGLKAYKELLPLFKKILSPTGRAYVEHGYKQQEMIIELAERAGLKVVERLYDLAKHPRGLILSL